MFFAVGSYRYGIAVGDVNHMRFDEFGVDGNRGQEEGGGGGGEKRQSVAVPDGRRRALVMLKVYGVAMDNRRFDQQILRRKRRA